jgi:hypothetical protein
MSSKNTKNDGFLAKKKKVFAKYRNNKKRFTESEELQDNRAHRISFKNYLRELEEVEIEDDLDDEGNE